MRLVTFNIACILLALTPSLAAALEFSFTKFSCSQVAFDYKLDTSPPERAANVLLINYKDETIDVVDITAPYGNNSFDPTVITEAKRYDFTVALGSDKCDVIASNGDCYEAGKNTLYAIAISQEATCDGDGTEDADSIDTFSDSQSANDDDTSITETSAVVPDADISTAAAVTVSVTSSASPTGEVSSQSKTSPAAATIIAASYPTSTSSTANISSPNSGSILLISENFILFSIGFFTFFCIW